MEHSRLLSLPKELRLEIWTYALTDPSMDLVVHIQRKNLGLSTSAKTKLEMPRMARINLHLLRANRFIYDEAIPVLYRSVIFHPHDIEGIFPLFLETISPFAQSHIRYIKLSVFPDHINEFYFHWAITCAQVAKLNASLRRVDIEGFWPMVLDSKNLHRILNPLAKIKAPKKLDSPNMEFQRLFQESMDEATRRLESRLVTRKPSITAETTDELRRGYSKRVEYCKSSQKRPRLYDLVYREEATLGSLCVPAEGNENEEASETAKRIKESETNLQWWDMVSSGDEAVNSKKRRASLLDDETLADTASTTIAKEDDLENPEDSEDWELVSEPSSPT